VTVANIAIYIALIVYVVARRMIGVPAGPPRKLFALPVIAVVIGWGDATKGLHKPVDVTLTVAGCALSLALGLARGRADRMSARDGALYVQWTWLSLGLFAVNLLVKLGLDLAGVAAGETAAAAGHSLILTIGLTLLGEAAVIWYRSAGAGHADQYAGRDEAGQAWTNLPGQYQQGARGEHMARPGLLRQPAGGRRGNATRQARRGDQDRGSAGGHAHGRGDRHQGGDHQRAADRVQRGTPEHRRDGQEKASFRSPWP